jgi:hypothetical protein
MQDILNARLKRTYQKVVKQQPKDKENAGYAAVPAGALVANALSNQACFAECLYRRKGYIVHVSAKKLSAFTQDKLSKERARWMEDAWLRGVIWAPLKVRAIVDNGRWVVQDISDSDVALFLKDRQDILVLQVIEPKCAQGTKDKLALLRNGLYLADGSHCPVLIARVTL